MHKHKLRHRKAMRTSPPSRHDVRLPIFYAHPCHVKYWRTLPDLHSNCIVQPIILLLHNIYIRSKTKNIVLMSGSALNSEQRAESLNICVHTIEAIKAIKL